MSKEKLDQSKAFAKERNLNVLEHLLQPRVKGISLDLACQMQSNLFSFHSGFLATMHGTRSKLDAVYGNLCAHVWGLFHNLMLHADLTIGYSRRAPNMFSLLCGLSKVDLAIHVQRFDAKSLPHEDDKLRDWLYARWAEKDKLLAYHKQHGSFPGKKINRPFPARKISRALTLWVVVNAIIITLLYFVFRRLYFMLLRN